MTSLLTVLGLGRDRSTDNMAFHGSFRGGYSFRYLDQLVL